MLLLQHMVVDKRKSSSCSDAACKGSGENVVGLAAGAPEASSTCAASPLTRPIFPFLFLETSRYNAGSA